MSAPNLKKKRDRIKSLIINSLIGKKISIIKHSDPTLIGISGIVLHDRPNTLTIRSGSQELVVSKQTGTFGIEDDEMNINIQGTLLLGSLKKRGKRKLRGW